MMEVTEPALPVGAPLSPAQLAKRWGISTKTLERWRAIDYGPPFLKFGSLVRYPAAGVLDFEGIGLAA
jgi:hypothetical protein